MSYVGAKALPSVAEALLQAAGRKIAAAWFGARGIGISVGGVNFRVGCSTFGFCGCCGLPATNLDGSCRHRVRRELLHLLRTKQIRSPPTHLARYCSLHPVQTFSYTYRSSNLL